MNNKTVQVKYHFISDETKKKLLDYYQKKWEQSNKVIRLK